MSIETLEERNEFTAVAGVLGFAGNAAGDQFVKCSNNFVCCPGQAPGQAPGAGAGGF
jgi:hypothetical protein